jgi:DNA mismatch repair ATPase MutS
VFDFIENYKFKKESYLIKLCSSFLKAEESSSYLINKIKSTTGLLRMRKGNPLIWGIITALFPIDLYFKSRLYKYKALISLRIREWLEVWYNLEALSSLANFAFLNPEYSFPEILQNKDEGMITFAGEQLAHPLIKSDSKIANDFSFNQTSDIVIITGSNMSGKSTFIRTLGVNLLLAYAGSAVNAQSFKISLFRLYTCIGITDSLTNGISYFYAEVKALRKLLDKAKLQGFPVFFLIDEIFRGTNNIERLKGSYAFLKALAQTNVVGALATHDLELVKLSEEIHGIKNYHFKEEVKDGKMIFDYKLNTGPCPTTNALKIMKLEGLPIE